MAKIPKTRVMYIEQKSGQNPTPPVIGRVTFSRSGRTLYYKDIALRNANGRGVFGNYFGYTKEDTFLGEFWVSGPKKDGRDARNNAPVGVDPDAQEEYRKIIQS